MKARTKKCRGFTYSESILDGRMFLFFKVIPTKKPETSIFLKTRQNLEITVFLKSVDLPIFQKKHIMAAQLAARTQWMQRMKRVNGCNGGARAAHCPQMNIKINFNMFCAISPHGKMSKIYPNGLGGFYLLITTLPTF